MQDPSFRANPDGSWQARNGEWSPPNYQTATPGLTQGPGQPNLGWSGNQAPQINTPQQPVQQAPQAPQPAQQAPQQPAQAPQNPAGQQPVEQAPQQPAQQNWPQTGQNQTGQTQPGQQPQKEPEAPKKNPMDPTDLASAATRRGSQQAGEQAGQQAVQQGTQQATQQAPKSTAQTQQAPQSTQQGQQTPKPAQQSQQAPQQTKPTNGKPKGIDGAAKGAPEEQPWDVTGEVKPIHQEFPNGSQKVGVEGRYGLQNKDPISLGESNVGQFDLGSSLQQKFGVEGEVSSMVNPPESGSNLLVPKAEAFAGYNLENKNVIFGPGVQGTITNTLKVGPSLSKGATTGTPMGANAVFQNLGNGKFFINLPVSVPYKAVEVGSTIQGVVDVPQLIQGTLGQAGQWITSGIPSVFGG